MAQFLNVGWFPILHQSDQLSPPPSQHHKTQGLQAGPGGAGSAVSAFWEAKACSRSVWATQQDLVTTEKVEQGWECSSLAGPLGPQFHSKNRHSVIVTQAETAHLQCERASSMLLSSLGAGQHPVCSICCLPTPTIDSFPKQDSGAESKVSVWGFVFK